MSETKNKDRKPRHLPNRDFISTTAAWQGTLLSCRDLYDGYSLDDPVLAGTPLKKCGWATLFAYMHRRFGPPHVGGDDYKDLSASWMLTTPDPEVFLSVSPSLSGPGFSFSPYLLKPSNAPKNVHAARDLGLSQQRITEIQQAYKSALLDLLRPVCVRDHQINAMGELGDSALDEALQEWDEENDCEVYEVRFHPSSGYSMPSGLFGGEDWATFCTLIRQLGDGDMATGRSKIIETLQRQVFAEAASEGWAVHRLMLLNAGKFQKKVAAGLGLDEHAISRFDQERKALHDRKNPDYSFVEEMTDAAVDAAAQFLKRLGFGGDNLGQVVSSIRRDKANAEAWADFLAVTQGQFPDDVSLPGNPYALAEELPLRLKETFDGIGRTDLSDWVGRTWERLEGPLALADITYYIAEQVKKAPQVAPSTNP